MALRLSLTCWSFAISLVAKVSSVFYFYANFLKQNSIGFLLCPCRRQHFLQTYGCGPLVMRIPEFVTWICRSCLFHSSSHVVISRLAVKLTLGWLAYANQKSGRRFWNCNEMETHWVFYTFLNSCNWMLITFCIKVANTWLLLLCKACFLFFSTSHSLLTFSSLVSCTGHGKKYSSVSGRSVGVDWAWRITSQTNAFFWWAPWRVKLNSIKPATASVSRTLCRHVSFMSSLLPYPSLSETLAQEHWSFKLWLQFTEVIKQNAGTGLLPASCGCSRCPLPWVLVQPRKYLHGRLTHF